MSLTAQCIEKGCPLGERMEFKACKGRSCFCGKEG